MRRPRIRRIGRAGRDPLGAERLVTGRFDHRYRRFTGPLLDEVAGGSPATGARASGVVVGLHGLGSNESQFATLLPLDLPRSVSYVGLRAPIDYGREAFSWYDPLQPVTELEQGPVVDRVADFVLSLRDRLGVAADATTVIGYSQAAPLAVALASLRPEVADNIALGSAALPPGLTGLGPGRPRRSFITIGEKDPFVEFASLDEVIDAWALTGKLTVCRYGIPHVMSPGVARDITQWIRPTIATAADRRAMTSEPTVR